MKEDTRTKEELIQALEGPGGALEYISGQKEFIRSLIAVLTKCLDRMDKVEKCEELTNKAFYIHMMKQELNTSEEK